MNKTFLTIMLFGVATLAAPVAARATSITVSFGNTSSSLTNGSTATSAAVLTAQSGSPSPFNGPCGADGSSNCNPTPWTFTYAIPSGESVTAADLKLGIFDIDSKAAGDQVAAYRIVGGDDLTSALNTAANGLNGGTGSVNSEYDVLTFALSNLSALNGGSATVQLTLQGPGLGVLGNSNFNGASLVFATLDLTTAPGSGGNPNNPDVPEPATILLVATGFGAVAARRRGAKS